MKNLQTFAVDLKSFFRYFDISETSSLLLMEMQKEIALKNVKVEEALLGLGEFINFEEFSKFLEANKIQVQGFTEEETKHLFE